MKTTTVCHLCFFLHKICCKIVWKFCEIWIFYGKCLPGGQNSVRFNLTVWDMACMMNTLSEEGTRNCFLSFWKGMCTKLVKRKNFLHLKVFFCCFFFFLFECFLFPKGLMCRKANSVTKVVSLVQTGRKINQVYPVSLTLSQLVATFVVCW